MLPVADRRRLDAEEQVRSRCRTKTDVRVLCCGCRSPPRGMERSCAGNGRTTRSQPNQTISSTDHYHLAVVADHRDSSEERSAEFLAREPARRSAPRSTVSVACWRSLAAVSPVSGFQRVAPSLAFVGSSLARGRLGSVRRATRCWSIARCSTDPKNMARSGARRAPRLFRAPRSVTSADG